MTAFEGAQQAFEEIDEYKREQEQMEINREKYLKWKNNFDTNISKVLQVISNITGCFSKYNYISLGSHYMKVYNVNYKIIIKYSPTCKEIQNGKSFYDAQHHDSNYDEYGIHKFKESENINEIIDYLETRAGYIYPDKAKEIAKVLSYYYIK